MIHRRERRDIRDTRDRRFRRERRVIIMRRDIRDITYII